MEPARARVDATEAAPSSAMERPPAERSDKLMVAEAVSEEAKLERLLGEQAIDANSAWTSSWRREAEAADIMLPAKPNWLADSQSSRSLSPPKPRSPPRRYN